MPLGLLAIDNLSTKYIFASSRAGDRSHNALNSFLNENTLEDEKIFFCKSNEEAIQKAERQKGLVFLKLASVPNFYIHNNIITALREYKISKVHALIKQKTRYCLLRHKKALENKIELSSVASTTYTLNLHKKWIQRNHLSEIEVPAGSSEAARLLSDEILNLNTGVIASGHASTVYKNLKVIKSDLNSKATYDIFALVEVKKRNKKNSISNIEHEINHIFHKGKTTKSIN